MHQTSFDYRPVRVNFAARLTYCNYLLVNVMLLAKIIDMTEENQNLPTNACYSTKFMFSKDS